jgi:hypothetical protein
MKHTKDKMDGKLYVRGICHDLIVLKDVFHGPIRLGWQYRRIVRVL